MKIQLVGFGNVGRSLVTLLAAKETVLHSLGTLVEVVSISDSKGTAIEGKGLDLHRVLKWKNAEWRDSSQYVKGYSALDAIRDIESDILVELTPSTCSGEPGLTNIQTALMNKKHVVSANKGPLVVAFNELARLAENNHVKLLYEATVAAHLPVFCLVESCFKADELVTIEGILNATTNFIIGEMEKGGDFEQALDHAIEVGWAETDCSDDVDGVDSARKVVILANSLFGQTVKMDNVRVRGIKNIGDLLKKARNESKKVKLVCEISKKCNRLDLCVEPRLITLEDPLATVNGGDMGLKFVFATSKQIFVSAQFTGVEQTAYALLNDILKISRLTETG